MFLPSLIGAVFEFITLELPLNVTAARLSKRIAPPLRCDERRKKDKEKSKDMFLLVQIDFQIC